MKGDWRINSSTTRSSCGRGPWIWIATTSTKIGSCLEHFHAFWEWLTARSHYVEQRIAQWEVLQKQKHRWMRYLSLGLSIMQNWQIFFFFKNMAPNILKFVWAEDTQHSASFNPSGSAGVPCGWDRCSRSFLWPYRRRSFACQGILCYLTVNVATWPTIRKLPSGLVGLQCQDLSWKPSWVPCPQQNSTHFQCTFMTLGITLINWVAVVGNKTHFNGLGFIIPCVGVHPCCQQTMENLKYLKVDREFHPSGGVKNNFSTVVIHPTAYDGCVEVAALQSGAWVVGTSTIDTQYKFARDVVKNHLLQEQLI